MFCIKCVKNISDSAMFCAGCGTKVLSSKSPTPSSNIPNAPKVPNPSENFKPNYDAIVKVTLQGIAQDLSAENGSYDSVELGNKTVYDFGEILHRLTMIRPMPPQPPNADICPPSLVIEAGNDLHAFEISAGSVIYSNDNRVVSVEEAIEIVSGYTKQGPQVTKDYDGNVFQNSSVWGTGHKDIRGLTPVRKPQIPPTDRVNSDSSTINIYNTPHFCDMVIKSHSSTGLYKAPIIFSIITIALTFGGFAVAEFVLAIICLFLTIGLFLLAILIKSKAKADLCIGFDWTQNMVYAKPKLQKFPSYLGNANCITGFSVSKTKIDNRRVQNLGTGSNPMITSVKDDYDTWQIMVAKTDGSNIPLTTLYREDEAVRVCQKVNGLLSQQI